MARFLPMLRLTPTAGVVQNTPMLNARKRKRGAVGCHGQIAHRNELTARGAMPWTRAMTG